MITEEVYKIQDYITKTFPTVRTSIGQPPDGIRLSSLFPEPENKGLKHIWKYGSADLVIFRNGVPVCIIEPGGSQHFEEHQSLNDRRKWKLCEINDVRCLNIMNGLLNGLSNRKAHQLIGGFIYGTSKSKD